MAGFWTSGFSDVNHFTILPFHSSSDAQMIGQSVPDGSPTVMDSLASQAEANAVQNMIRQDGYEKMAI